MQRAFVTLIQLLFTLSILALIVAGFRNLLDDNYEVTQRAKALACSGEPPGCAVDEMFLQRSFYAQTFDFTSRRSRSVHVRCVRDMVLIGDYGCTVSAPYEALNAQPSAAPSAAPSAPRRALR